MEKFIARFFGLRPALNSLRPIILGIFMLGTTCLSAQLEVPGYDIRRIGGQNGLINQVITSLARDQDNIIWFGTLNGLYRFDGLRTVRIDTKYNHLPLQYSNAIVDLAIDTTPGGVLFLCTKSQAEIVDPRTGKFISPGEIGIPDGLYKGFKQIERGNGDFFYGLNEQIIYKISKIGAGQYTCLPWCKIQQGATYVNNMVSDPEDPESVWILLESDQVWHAGAWGLETYKLPEPQKKFHGTRGLVQLTFTPNGMFGWDLTRNIFRFDKSRKQFVSFNESFGMYDLVPNLVAVDIAMRQKESLRCTLQLDINQIILGTTLGMFIVRKKTNGFKAIEALREEEIRGIHIDSSGNWIVGSYYGLFTGRLGDPVVKKFGDLKIVWDLLPMPGNQYLFAMENRNGLRVWDPVREKIVDSTIIWHMTDPKLGHSALTLERDHTGKTWVGSYFYLLWSPPDSPLVFTVYQDPATGARFNHGFIRNILATRNNDLWIGAEDGLYCMQYNAIYGQYQLKNANSYLGKLQISDMYEDRHGNLWVATKGKGLARLNNDGQLIRYFNLESGICDTMICRIESSNNDSVLWMSTHNGLSRMDVSTGIFHNYYEENGFPGNEFNSAASTRDKDGALYFGGVNGLIYFHPDSIAFDAFQYKTSVPFIQVYNHGIDTLITLNQYTNGFNTGPYPELIEFALVSNELIRPEKIRYRYRLSGLSDKWNYTSGEDKVKFVHLTPGHYIFEAQAIPLEGHFGAVYSLPVFIATPYYETWWFRTLIICTILLMGYGAYRYLIWQMRKEQLIRQQIADDLHDDIGNKLNIIGIIAQKVAVFLKKNNAPLTTDNSFEKLIDLSRETQITLITMIWAVDPRKDRLMNLIVRMQDFADDFIRPLLQQFHFTAPKEVPNRDLNLRARHHIILIYQELLTNMIKHTHAVKISVDLFIDGDKIILILTNQHRTDFAQIFDTISGNRGQSTLNRRLKDIRGTLEFLEPEASIQKITLVVPNIFR